MRSAMAAHPQASPQAPAAKTLSQRLGEFAAALRWGAVPAAVRERARYLILDCIGCALAAKRFDFAARSLRAIAELAGPGDSVVIGHALRLPLRDAVLANGLLAHGLDYDDTHSEGIIHLSVSAFPTALGVAAQLDLAGRDLLAAYVVALEAGARIGAVAKGRFHAAGFHPTGLVGAFACALAAGRLQGLTPAQLAAAQGVALSVASGSLEFLEDGSWTKRFHPGWAGVGGIVAAAMAKQDFPAPPAAYEGRFGLYASHLGDAAKAFDFGIAAANLGSVWETMNIAVKPFPICHFAHAFADAAIALRAKGVQAAKVSRITALVPAEIVQTVCEPAAKKRHPANDYDAKFSLPYVIAASLVRGAFGLAELEDAALRDSAILALASKVDYAIDPRSTFPRHYCGEVVVRMEDGAELRHREPVNRGSAERPLTNADIEAKFLQNAGYAVDARRAAEIRDAVLALETTPSARAFAQSLGERG